MQVCFTVKNSTKQEHSKKVLFLIDFRFWRSFGGLLGPGSEPSQTAGGLQENPGTALTIDHDRIQKMILDVQNPKKRKLARPAATQKMFFIPTSGRDFPRLQFVYTSEIFDFPSKISFETCKMISQVVGPRKHHRFSSKRMFLRRFEHVANPKILRNMV